jgi:cell division septal protein FtsQ
VIWKKKSEDDSLPPAVRSWRQIEQSAQRHVVSVLMRRRRIFTLLRFTGLSLGLVALIVVSGYAVFLFNTRPREMSIALPGEPIRQVVFESNGVLTPDWFARTFELVPHITLMETDIFALKTRLEEVAQIRFATVSRYSPIALRS